MHGRPGGGHPGAKGSGAGAKDADDQGLGDLQLPKGFEKFLGGGGHGKG